MRIVAWNINQGAHRKAAHLLELEPDIAVLPECADLPALGDGALIRAGWTGRNAKKGLGVFVRPGLTAVIDDAWDPGREWWLPIRVASANGPLVDVLAVWAFNRRGKEYGPRLGRTHRVLEQYRPFLDRRSTVVIGDFNDNVRWDTPSNPSFARTVEILAESGYRSVYHDRTGAAPGAETDATLYWYRHLDRPYFIDYAFVPEAWLPSIRRFELGDPQRWLAWSDHVPLILDLDVLQAT